MRVFGVKMLRFSNGVKNGAPSGRNYATPLFALLCRSLISALYQTAWEAGLVPLPPFDPKRRGG